MDSSAQSASKRWRMSRAEVQKQAWCPLEPEVKPEEFIPEEWDGPHAGVRLVDAFRTLKYTPIRSVSNASGFWPAYLYEWADLVAQDESGVTKAEQEAERRRKLERIKPSRLEIAQMEIAISWAGKYISAIGIARVVQRVAIAVVNSPDDPWSILDQLEHSKPWVYSINNMGLDLIAAGLRRDAIAVY